MTRSIVVGEVRTGRRIAQIPVSGATWSTAHRGTGSINIDIPLGASEFKTLERVILAGQYPSTGLFPGVGAYPASESAAWKAGDGLRSEFLSAIEPARCFMAVAEGDSIIEGGPIWPWSMAPGSTTLKVGASGMRSIFDHRRVMGVIDSGFAAWQVIYSGMSLGTIAKRVVQLAMAHPGGDLPIVLPDDILAVDNDDHRRTYKGSELGTVLDRLNQLMSVLSGPDIAFDPRFTVDRLGVEWVMRTGTEVDPLLHQPGADHIWDFRVPRGGVKGIGIERDGSGMASRSWATGATTDLGPLMSRKDSPVLTANGFPLLEIVEARTGVELQATLDGWASGNLAASARPMMAVTADVRTDMPPLLGSYRPGDYASIWAPTDHPLLSMLWANGVQQVRIANIAGGLDNWAAVKFLPKMEGR